MELQVFLFRTNPIVITLRLVVVDGRAVAEVVRLLGEGFSRLVKHAAFDAKHHGWVLHRIGCHGDGFIDFAYTVGPVCYLDDFRFAGKDGILRPGGNGASAARLGL